MARHAAREDDSQSDRMTHPLKFHLKSILSVLLGHDKACSKLQQSSRELQSARSAPQHDRLAS